MLLLTIKLGTNTVLLWFKVNELPPIIAEFTTAPDPITLPDPAIIDTLVPAADILALSLDIIDALVIGFPVIQELKDASITPAVVLEFIFPLADKIVLLFQNLQNNYYHALYLNNSNPIPCCICGFWSISSI
jgi:hypothetical protein